MSEIEPVTERDIDEVLNARAAGYDIRYALEQDRRRVAERQAARIADQPMSDYEIGHMEGAEMVVGTMGAEIERLRAEVAKMHARRAVLFGELIELKHAIENGHRASAIAIIDAIARVIPDQSKTLAELRAEVARLTAALNGKENSDA